MMTRTKEKNKKIAVVRGFSCSRAAEGLLFFFCAGLSGLKWGNGKANGGVGNGIHSALHANRVGSIS